MIKVFLAGASGFTGMALLKHPDAHLLDIVIHLREGSPSIQNFEGDQRVRIAPFEDRNQLAKAMTGCDAILSTIGTIRARFKEGVSYETVDYGTTVALIEAAKIASVGRFVLMSSLGAGHPVGPYLQWKNKAEQALIQSGLDYTIVRPSYLMGEGRARLPGIGPVMDGIGKLPGLGKIVDDFRPIPIEVLVRNYIRMLADNSELNKILTGRDLWSASGKQDLQ